MYEEADAEEAPSARVSVDTVRCGFASNGALCQRNYAIIMYDVGYVGTKQP